jgi:hypothetical protein
MLAVTLSIDILRWGQYVMFCRRNRRREINDVSDGDCAEEAGRYLDFLEVLLVPIARDTRRC